jgi:signal transduction histidine kinase/CheY-like chemotaxis protein
MDLYCEKAMPMPEPTHSRERILILAPTGRDAPLAWDVFKRADLAAEVCHDVGDLCRRIEAGGGAGVLTEEALPPAALDRLVATLRRQPPWSDFPLIVFANRGEISQAGPRPLHLLESLRNVTFLERPIRVLTLLSVVRAALDSRRRQYEVRDLLLRLEEGVQQRDEFLAMLGHELRNPLGAIRNAMQILNRIGSQEEHAAGTRLLIDRQVRHLIHLVDDLLDVSRVTSGKIVLQRRGLDLRDVAQRCVQALDSAIKEQRHTLSLTLADEPLLLEADVVRLDQVVTNLLTNAIKYTPPAGRIEVRAVRENREGVIRVRDSGIGIAPEILPQIFELFSQGPATLARSQGGLGIGLTVVRRLVEMHGGSISAASAGPGKGSEFCVRLPLIANPVRRLEAVPEATSDPPLPGSRHILVIEDNADNRDTLQRVLRLLGHQVDVAEDGERGVAKALALHPDVALVDIGLPGLDGYQVAQQVRSAPGGADIMLIALTGYGRPEDRRRALTSGFNAHLVKPVDLDRLGLLLSGRAVEARSESSTPV